ncbi:hypothetical protein B0I00_2412 [Novosphingobium kunmingense]|uniref:Nuclease-like protein n=1 Tax=Novosphingobium kunmingense TaxID=1211806 RepID=A0A2N0H7F5_9SPHN|nr:thermonuclease family protein [Novosphingobium kunmingense]PKB14810.1 hypothetical protein B0I00_2412 [Novosphingobium kunmingense]
MGDLIPFRRKKRKTWTKPDDYGHVLPTNAWRGAKPGKPLKKRLQLWILPILFVAILAWTYWSALPQRATAPDARSQRIDPPVTACGAGPAQTCVIDGDTIKVGARTIRVIGIDAPEISPPRCVEEAAKGLAARDRLVALANQGPFFLTGTGEVDEYSRELFNLVRVRSDNSLQSLAQEMIDGGFARPYAGGARRPWC